ncbi:sentrin-specific protease 1-like isoform X1 [Pieris brassicae]|uniref:sentrin-specific protease 1-like isoform X1 n=1 Tax=Pieris brassicae TaxID=7116 RepID=UPI001E66245D|nr:sentrin-specific protease 1-like isoform X1 [Pieris brassicae]
MQSVVSYVRSLLGWAEEDEIKKTIIKRHRYDDDYSGDGRPKKLKHSIENTIFPGVMTSKDLFEDESYKNVRMVPIEIEDRRPSTSTPYENLNKENRIRTVPVKIISRQNGSLTPIRKEKPPANRVVRAVLIDDDDAADEQEVTLVETQPPKENPKLYINLDDDEDNDRDVVFVKKVSSPASSKPFKLVIDDNDTTDFAEPTKYRQYRKIVDRGTNVSPRSYSILRNNGGIQKSYKKAPTPSLPNWLSAKSTMNARTRNNLNGTKSTLLKLFNIEEKNNFRELIKKVCNANQTPQTQKPIDIINLAEESASFRLTRKSQRSSLNEIKRFEKDLKGKDSESTTEYDPITVASITSSDSEIEVIPSDSSVSSTRIEPLNTLRDSFRDRDVVSSDWLRKLDTKYKNKKKETQVKLNDARRESDIISKVNHEQCLAHLRNKLKYELCIPESLIEEDQPAVELPPLTAEQEKLVSRALGPGPQGQVLIEKFNLRITRRDLQTLSGLNWLNDEVINFYMNLLMQRCGERKDLPQVYAANTFFYPKLMQSGQAGLRRWTRKVDIFAHQLMVVPVHLGVHWCMSIIDFREKKISYMDSMGGKNQAALVALLQYLRDEHKDKKGQPFDDSGWKTECLRDIPQQMNGSDCGMFACTFAEFSSRNARYTFTQADMPYLRRKAAFEILQGKLLL